MQKIIGMFVCGAEPWGREGGWGLGGTWKFPKLGPTQMTVCGGWGCTYVCMLHTYICTYIFVIKISDLDPHILTKYMGHHFKTLSPNISRTS